MVTKYLISTDGHRNTILSNEDGVIIYVEYDTDVKKAIMLWADNLAVEIDYDSIEIDFALKEVNFMWDNDYNGIEYYYGAFWKLIEITKP